MNWVRLAQADTNTWSTTNNVESTSTSTTTAVSEGTWAVSTWSVAETTNTWTGETVATNALFTLWERDVNIIVKNASNTHPENTVFKVGEKYYKGSYLVQDFLNAPKDGITVEFNNLKCNYSANIKIDPTVYIKNVVISYGYNSRWDCIHKVEPEEMVRLVAVKTSERMPLNYTIQLNDLSPLHFIAYGFLWLFVAIYLWIIYIQKKKVLIYNKNN